jgi:tetratricopeptide (TPR) repeat protein
VRQVAQARRQELLLDTLSNCALCQIKLEHWRIAADFALECIQLDACHVKALYRYAVACEQLGEYTVSVFHADRALKCWDESKFGACTHIDKLLKGLQLHFYSEITLTLESCLGEEFSQCYSQTEHTLRPHGAQVSSREVQKLERRYGPGRYNIEGEVRLEVDGFLFACKCPAAIARYICHLVMSKASAKVQIAREWAAQFACTGHAAVAGNLRHLNMSKAYAKVQVTKKWAAQHAVFFEKHMLYPASGGGFFKEILQRTDGMRHFYELMQQGDLCSIECVLSVLSGLKNVYFDP